MIAIHSRVGRRLSAASCGMILLRLERLYRTKVPSSAHLVFSTFPLVVMGHTKVVFGSRSARCHRRPRPGRLLGHGRTRWCSFK